jgi:hypothetical protein
MLLLQATVWTVLHQSQPLLMRFDVRLLLVQHRSIQHYFPLLLVLYVCCSLRCHAKSFLLVRLDLGNFLASCGSNSAEDNRD